MVKRIHHINFLVKELEEAVARYQDLWVCHYRVCNELPDRRVRIARMRLDETWIVLVQPTDSQSVPAKRLERHGEGFF